MGSREVCKHNMRIHDDGLCACIVCFPPGPAPMEVELATLRAERDELQRIMEEWEPVHARALEELAEARGVLGEVMGTTVPCCCGRDHIVEGVIGDRGLVRRAVKGAEPLSEREMEHNARVDSED